MASAHLSSHSLLEIFEDYISEGLCCILDGRIVYHNQAFRRMIGLEDSEEVPDISEIFVDTTLHDLHLSGNQDEKIRCSKRDGTGFWCIVRVRSKGPYIVITVQDISRRIEQEDILKKQTDDLRKLNHKLDRFLYSASHDIRQPLTSILGLVSLMRIEPSLSNGNEYFDKIERSVNTLDKFVRHVIDITRNMHTRIKGDQIDIEKTVRMIISNYLCTSSAIRMHTEVQVYGDYAFYSDLTRIRTIFTNVIDNAFQYSKNREESFVKIWITLESDRAIIDVVDNGHGIPESYVGRIFDMFFRGHERSQGSGLGLYVARETLLTLGGTITVDSEAGLGTMIQITIPNCDKGILINRKKKLTTKNHP